MTGKSIYTHFEALEEFSDMQKKAIFDMYYMNDSVPCHILSCDKEFDIPKIVFNLYMHICSSEPDMRVLWQGEKPDYTGSCYYEEVGDDNVITFPNRSTIEINRSLYVNYTAYNAVCLNGGQIDLYYSCSKIKKCKKENVDCPKFIYITNSVTIESGINTSVEHYWDDFDFKDSIKGVLGFKNNTKPPAPQDMGAVMGLQMEIDRFFNTRPEVATIQKINYYE